MCDLPFDIEEYDAWLRERFKDAVVSAEDYALIRGLFAKEEDE